MEDLKSVKTRVLTALELQFITIEQGDIPLVKLLKKSYSKTILITLWVEESSHPETWRSSTKAPGSELVVPLQEFVSSVARNRNWCRDQDRENCTSELPVADLQHHPKTTPTEEEATVRRLYVRPPVEHLRII
nr:unnamed protein product [Callosobruchus analis]